MKLVLQDRRSAVYDDVFSLDEFHRLWLHVQNEDYQSPTRGGNWIKVWRLGDATSMSSREYLYSKRPFNNVLDSFAEKIAEIAAQHTEIVGAQGTQWNDVSMRSYLYPRGTKLSWHEDSGGYTGAFIFYAHPKWASTWGGELLLAETEEFADILRDAPCGPYLDRKWEDRYLFGAGHGRFILAKPNRLVLTGRNVYHSVNRIDPDAGDNVRCSISGFFKRPQG